MPTTLEDKPFFSVVIPVYNRASNIKPIINSVLNQSFDSWELLIVDDGSADRGLLIETIDSYADRRIKILCRENGGGGKARNTGIDAASGMFIALLDSDDFFIETKLQDCYDLIQNTKGKDKFIFSHFIVDRGLEKTWIKPERLLRKDERVDEYLTCTSGWIQTSTMVLDSDLAKRVRFSDKLPSSQDTDFAIRCFLAGANFYFIDKPLSVMNDVYDPTRVSKQKNVEPLLLWATEMLNCGMTKKSSLGYKGWQCARIISETSRMRALSLFLHAMLNGCYSMFTAIRIFLQIILKERHYQSVMNYAVFLLGRKN